MKHFKNTCYVATSFVLGLVTVYIAPVLLMFGFNKAKGAGVNPEGAMFQLPAWILLFLLIVGIIIIERKLIKTIYTDFRRFIPMSYMVGGILALILWLL